MKKLTEKPAETTEVTVIKPSPATIQNPDSDGDTVNVGIPGGWEAAKALQSGLTPVALMDEPGDYVSGIYGGQIDNVGPNHSRMYRIKLGDNLTVSVWGSTALDNIMDLSTPKVGGHILIQYLGSKPTSRGLSPVKIFRVLVQ